MFTKFYLISTLFIGISAVSASDSGFTTSSDSDSGDEGSRKRSFHKAQAEKSSLIDNLLADTTVMHKGKTAENRVKYEANDDSVKITENNPAYTARHTFKRLEYKEGYGITGYFKKLKTN
jgi:hypothetical protein